MLLPQLAQQTDLTSLDKFFNDDSWVMEQKLDGHRLLLRSPGMDMAPTALTRNGTLYSRKLSKAIMDFRFPEGDWALDGELIGTVVNGHTVSSTFWVFDLPIAPIITPGGGWELWQRRAALEALLANIDHPFKLVPQARTKNEKIALTQQSLANNFEGLVLKKRDSPYRSGGRTPEWLKVKYVVTADCVVLDVRDDGKESVRLGMWSESLADNPHAQLLEVGRSSLIGKEKAGSIKKGDVIEVRYLYAGANGRLYQPTILRKRHDKHAVECLIAQMKHVNKTVLEAL